MRSMYCLWGEQPEQSGLAGSRRDERVKNASGILQGRSRDGGEEGPTKFSAENYGWVSPSHKRSENAAKEWRWMRRHQVTRIKYHVSNSKYQAFSS